MRVLMLSDRYLPIVGGTERQLASLAPRLVALGHELSIVTRRPSPDLAAEERIDSISVRRLRPYGYGKLANGLIIPRLLAYLIAQRQHYDLIHAHTIGPIGIAAIMAGRLLHKPVILKVATEGDIARAVDKAQGISKLIRRFIVPPALWRAILNQASSFVALTPAIICEAQSIQLKAAVHLIPNGVDTAHYAPIDASARPALRQRLNLPVSAPILFTSNRLVQRKRLDVLLSAFQRVRQDLPQALLLIAGSGTLQADSVEGQLHQQAQELGIADAVRFLGLVDNISDYLRACDLFVFPSALEGLPNALLEAMACACPIVASDIEGVRAVADETCAQLLPVGEVARWADACTQLLTQTTRAQALGQAARLRVQERFSIEAIAEQYQALYERLLQPAPKL